MSETDVEITECVCGDNFKPIKLEQNVYLLGFNIIAPHTKIGRYSYVGEYSKVELNVSIGRYCSIATHVLIGATIHPQHWLSSSPFQYDGWLDSDCPKQAWNIAKPTKIGNDVWIGANVVIQSGVTVGDGAIIGSGAIVTKDVPPYSVVVGVPARVIKYRFPKEIIETLMELKWWKLPHNDIRQLNFSDINEAIKQIRAIKETTEKQD